MPTADFTYKKAASANVLELIDLEAVRVKMNAANRAMELAIQLLATRKAAARQLFTGSGARLGWPGPSTPASPGRERIGRRARPDKPVRTPENHPGGRVGHLGDGGAQAGN